MPTLPVFLCLVGRRCVVIGGDEGAEHKALACERSGGEVAVVAPQMTPGLVGMAAEGRLAHVARSYAPGDLAGAFLAYASAQPPETVAAIRDEAARERVLLNVVDVPAACSFHSPAVVVRGDLQIAIGTSGASPGLAARLRRDLERHFGDEYRGLVTILGAVRRRLEGRSDRTQVLAALLDSPLLDLVRARRPQAIDDLLERTAGPGTTLAALGVEAEA